MKIIFNIFVVTIIYFCSTSVNAAGVDYRCKIERISFSSGDSGNVHKMYSKAYLGEEFTVDRETGIMAGALKNSYATKPQVIGYGSAKNAYRVVTTMKISEGAGAGTYMSALNIDEFEKGPKKPFVFLEKNKVYFGVCEHF